MEKLACHEAIARLTALLDSAGQPAPETDAALQHMSACAACQARLAQLRSAMRVAEADRLTCADCEARLPEYAAADVDERARQARLRQVYVHLALCPHCARSYGELQELAAFAWEPEAIPPAYPRPDLSFLPQPAHWLDQLGRLVIRLRAVIETGGLTFSPTLAGAGLKSGQPAGGQPVTLANAAPDLAVTMAVTGQAGDASRCALLVKAIIPSRGNTLRQAGTEVVLQRDDRPVAMRTTNGLGEVQFEGLAAAELADLSVVINPKRGP